MSFTVITNHSQLKSDSIDWWQPWLSYTAKNVYLFTFVEKPRKFIIAELSIRKLGSSLVLIIILLALMKIWAYGSKAPQ